MNQFRVHIFTDTLLLILLIALISCGSTNSNQTAVNAQEQLSGANNSLSDIPSLPKITAPENLPNPPPKISDGLEIIWEAWEFLKEDYVDQNKLDSEAFAEQAIVGMLTALGDAQTSYVSPGTLKGSFGDTFRGAFEGIGAHVNMNRAGNLIIVSPIDGSPAKAAGIRAGDTILEVDGESLKGLSLLDAVSKIRGPMGTEVKLLVKHLGALDPVIIPVTRGRIPLQSVFLRSGEEDTFTHIRISQFFPNTIDPLRKLLTDEISRGSRGLVLDLRNNPGGTLDSVVDVASQFLTEGLVLYVKDGKGSRTNWKVRENGVAQDFPMVVLVNGGSGSSSEVLAGALQDHHRATIVGDTTFGKGSVNILRPLSNEGGLYITIAHWYTPNGRLIQNQGIEPDIKIASRDPRESDIQQLQSALAELERIVNSD